LTSLNHTKFRQISLDIVERWKDATSSYDYSDESGRHYFMQDTFSMNYNAKKQRLELTVGRYNDGRPRYITFYPEGEEFTEDIRVFTNDFERLVNVPSDIPLDVNVPPADHWVEDFIAQDIINFLKEPGYDPSIELALLPNDVEYEDSYKIPGYWYIKGFGYYPLPDGVTGYEYQDKDGVIQNPGMPPIPEPNTADFPATFPSNANLFQAYNKHDGFFKAYARMIVYSTRKDANGKETYDKRPWM
jgi:hypothetical protein